MTAHTRLIENLERALIGDFKQVGICGLILKSCCERNQGDAYRTLMFKVIRTKDYMSKNMLAPISSLHTRDGDTAFELYLQHTENLWDPTSAYCNRRIEVAKDMISILKGEMTVSNPYESLGRMLTKQVSGDPILPRSGICTLINTHVKLAYDHKVMVNALNHIIIQLGYFSELEVFTILPPEGYIKEDVMCESREAFIRNGSNLWNPEDAYCARRIEISKRLLKLIDDY